MKFTICRAAAILAITAFVFSATFFPGEARAYWPPHRPLCLGPQYVTSLISTTNVFTSPTCQPLVPLSFDRATHNYPILGALDVDFWTGSYERAALRTDVYQNDIYSCAGVLQSSQTTKSNLAYFVPFEIDNPNLHDDVSATFAANAPMTNREAAAALKAAKTKCETAVNPL